MGALLRGAWGIDHNSFRVLRLGGRDLSGRPTWGYWGPGVWIITFRISLLGARDAYGRRTQGY